MSKKLYILSVDGGGLKGLIAVRILKIIESISATRITDQFDLFGGTSTGGLIVAALNTPVKEQGSGHSLDNIETMYLQAGQAVFQQDNFQLSGNETDHLNELLTHTFGDKKLAQTVNPIFVPAFDLTENRVIIFKTRSAIQNKTKNVKLFDVCRATSAIPPIFPSYPMQFNGRMIKCVDGGFYMKNPSLAVLAEAWKHRSYYAAETLNEEDVVLLSVSTGNFSNKGKNWSTDIHDSLPEQNIAKNYIQLQDLQINLEKINYMRVDLDLGSSFFNLMKLIEISDRLDKLSIDRHFHEDVLNLLDPDS